MIVKLIKETKTAGKAAHKASSQPLYVKNTKKVWKGNVHIMPNGHIYSGLRHTATSKRLTFVGSTKKVIAKKTSKKRVRKTTSGFQL